MADASLQVAGLPAVGEVVAGKYRIDRVIAEGGMGVVLAASHLQLREQVALKFLLPEMRRRKDLAARFVREGQAAVRIKSEHVARVMDVGTWGDGVPYLVMELLNGMDLDQVLRARGPLPIGAAVDYVLQASRAIAEAHVLGIVHRDLKPANLFLTTRADGSDLVKVLDFGISKVPRVEPSGARDPSLTLSADVLGSPMYMSPEQIRDSKSVDARADIWALGAVLHKLLTGSPPFRGDSPAAVLAKIISEPPAILRMSRPDAPAELESILLRCMEKERSRRYADIAELGQALLPFAPTGARRFASAADIDPSRDSVPRVSGPPTSVTPATSPAERPTGADGEPAARRDAPLAPTLVETAWGTTGASRRRAAWWKLAAGATLVGALVALLLASRGESPSSSAPAALTIAATLRAKTSTLTLEITPTPPPPTAEAAPPAPPPTASAGPRARPTPRRSNAALDDRQ